MTQRERLLTTAAIVLGVVAVAWSAFRFADQRRAAFAAANDLVESRRLAARIEAGRVSGTDVASTEPNESEIIRRIETAARLAELPQPSIERIEPGQSQRIHDGKLIEKSTIVQLKNVTLRQVFAFFHAMNSGPSRLSVKQVRLSVASPDDTGDRWSVESTLTYFVRPTGEARTSLAE